jgi:hypothetical protein
MEHDMRARKSLFNPSVLFLLVFGILLAAGNTGCAPTPMGKALQVRKTVNASFSEVVQLRADKQIPDTAFVPLVNGFKVVTPFLDQLDAAAISGNKYQFDQALLNATDPINKFLRDCLLAKQKKG